MQEYKRLFRRDKIFLLCLSGAVAVILLFGLLNCCKTLNSYEELRQFYGGLYGQEFVETNLSDLQGVFTGFVETTCIYMMKCVFAAVVLAQMIKWSILEGKRGKEFQNLLPVKSASHVTYDYICGILFLWTPVLIEGIAAVILAKGYGLTFIDADTNYVYGEVMRELIWISFLYSLLVFAKKITRYIPGILLTVLVFGCAGLMSGQMTYIFWDWSWHIAEVPREYLLLLALIPVLVALSYWCDKKRDIAGNGLFYFKTVHFLMMAVIFAELFCIFAVSEIVPWGMAANMIGVLLAGAVTAGVHYLTWGGRNR